MTWHHEIPSDTGIFCVYARRVEHRQDILYWTDSDAAFYQGDTVTFYEVMPKNERRTGRRITGTVIRMAHQEGRTGLMIRVNKPIQLKTGPVTRTANYVLKGLVGLLGIVVLCLLVASLFKPGPPPPRDPGPEPKPETCNYPGWRTEVKRTEDGEWVCVMERGKVVKIFFY